MLRTLIKINFLRLMAPRRRKNGRPQIVSANAKTLIAVYAAIGLLFAFAFTGMAFGISEAAKVIGGWFFLEIAGTSAFLIMFIGSIFYAVNSLYDAKDNDLLLAMPIKPGTIVLSRLVTLLLMNAFYDVTAILPFAVVGSITGAITAMQAAMLIINNLFLMAGSNALICFIAWLISMATSRSRHKNAVQTVIMLFAFAVYMVIYPNMGRFVSLAVNEPEAVSAAMSKILPFYVFGKACAGDFGSAALFALCSAAGFAGAYWLLQHSFLKVLTTKISVIRREYRGGSSKARSRRTALVFKEIRRFVSSPVYMFNAGLGLIIMPAAAIYLAVTSGKENSLIALLGSFGSHTAAASAAAIMMFVLSMTMISAPSVSLEGKMLWIIRTSPARGSEVLTAKADAHSLICLPFTAVSSLITFIATRDAFGTLLVFVSLVAATAVMAHIGVTTNMRFPRFDNESDTRTIKQSAAVMLSMLWSALYTIATVFAGAVAARFIDGYAVLLISAAISAATAFLLRRRLKHSLADKFDSFPA